MKVLLLQLDGKIPNLALMRIAAHHRERGDNVELRKIGNVKTFGPHLWEKPDKVYASLIFSRSWPLAEGVLRAWPDAKIGGSGWDMPPLRVNTLCGFDKSLY